MILLKAQQELLDSNSNLTLLVGGYASGKTYGILYKALLSNTNVTIITLNDEFVMLTYDLLCDITSDITSDMVNNNIRINTNLQIITYEQINQLTHQDLIILDNFDTLNYKEAEDSYNKILSFTSHLIVTCNPASDCALDENFCYSLSQIKECNHIIMNLKDNHFLPKTYINKIKEYFA